MPHETAHLVEDFMEHGMVNIVGGCCGTTPDHIRCIAEKAALHPPRKKPEIEPFMRLSGVLKAVTVTPETNFINVGERYQHPPVPQNSVS